MMPWQPIHRAALAAACVLVTASHARAEPRVALPNSTTLYATADAARAATPPPVDPAAPPPRWSLVSASLLAFDGTIAKVRVAQSAKDCLPSISGLVSVVAYVPKAVLVARLSTLQTWREPRGPGAWQAAAGAPLARKGDAWVLADDFMAATQPPAVTLVGELAVEAGVLPDALAKGVRAMKCPVETRKACEARQRACEHEVHSLEDEIACVPYACSAVPAKCKIARGSTATIGAASAGVDETSLAFELGELASSAVVVYGFGPRACFAARGALSPAPVTARENGGASISGGRGAGGGPELVSVRKGTPLFWPDGTRAGESVAAWSLARKRTVPGERGRLCFTERWLDQPLCFSASK